MLYFYFFVIFFTRASLLSKINTCLYFIFFTWANWFSKINTFLFFYLFYLGQLVKGAKELVQGCNKLKKRWTRWKNNQTSKKIWVFYVFNSLQFPWATWCAVRVSESWVKCTMSAYRILTWERNTKTHLRKKCKNSPEKKIQNNHLRKKYKILTWKKYRILTWEKIQNTHLRKKYRILTWENNRILTWEKIQNTHLRKTEYSPEKQIENTHLRNKNCRITITKKSLQNTHMRTNRWRKIT